MTPEKRARLEAAGYTVTQDVGEILGFTEADRRVVEFRTALSRRVRDLRSGRGLTQRQLAEIIGVSQSRIPGIEKGDASLDAIASAIAALGGDLTTDLPTPPHPSTARRQHRSTGPITRFYGMARHKKRKRTDPTEA